MRHSVRWWLGQWLCGCMVLMFGLIAALPVPAVAQSVPTIRPQREYIAFGQVAVVRIITTYYGQSDTTLTTVPTACTGIGTIITTTPSAILTDSTIVHPTQPCQAVVAAYEAQYHRQPASWRLQGASAYLNTAYSGMQSGTIGSMAFPLDIAANLSLGYHSGPVVLPLLNEPNFDLPVITIAPPTSKGAMTIDLMTVLGQPLGTANTPAVLTTALTPVANVLVASQLMNVGIGSPILSEAPNGMAQLTGMIIMATQGPMLATNATITEALQQANLHNAAGKFSAQWHAALRTYYTAEGQAAAYARASREFSMLLTHYPRFQGVLSWLNAAQAGLPASEGDVNKSITDIIPGIPLQSGAGLAILGIAIILILIGLVVWVRAIRVGRRRSQSQSTHETTAPLQLAQTGPIPSVNERAAADTVPESQRSQPLTRTVPLPRNRRRHRLGILVSALTHPGIRRRADPNQDNILAVKGARLHDGTPQSFGLFIVADGMGGHQFGREASSRTIEVMMEHIIEPLLNGQPMKEEELLELLRRSVEEANAEIHRRNVHQNADMGTTVTAALVTGDVAHIVNVGDSRTYHVPADAQLQQVTADHSVVASLVAAGVIQPDEIYTHPKRNQVYRSLGEREDVQVDVFQVLLHEGDRLILCSDGLWEMVRDPRIEEIVRSDEDPREVAKLLIDEANRNGGVDNISAVVIGIQNEATPTQTGAEIIAAPDTLGKKLHKG